MARNRKSGKSKEVDSYRYPSDTRKNIPTGEYQSMLRDEEKSPLQFAYEQRNPDLDPQLVWRGKDLLSPSDLVVQAPPLYIQEKVHAKALVDDLMRQTDELRRSEQHQFEMDLFSDFNGVPDEAAKTEFYQHDANWTNRMILGDSLQVMASLAEREGLKGQVQCIYIDPPYGIGFASNFQWSTTNRIVKDGKIDHITREPEQVKAFRDTWKDGIHSYLSYLRDRIAVARELLNETGSLFVQIGDENIDSIRGVLNEVFGAHNFVALITFRKTSITFATERLGGVSDYILWYAKDVERYKYRQAFREKVMGGEGTSNYGFIQHADGSTQRLSKEQKERPKLLPTDSRIFSTENLMSSGATPSCIFDFEQDGKTYSPVRGRSWKTNRDGMSRLSASDRLVRIGDDRLYYKTFLDEYPITKLTNLWPDTRGEMDLRYVVQTASTIVQRCVLMCTDPGDLVLDPTCGSGTTAYVAEQWGRRWITIDTSRVALALARSRIMGARYPYYLKKDSMEGKLKEAELTRTEPSTLPTYDDIKQGFVYERVPHITLGAIANNAEIDVIWETYQEKLELLRERLNTVLGEQREEWEIPRESNDSWSVQAKQAHAEWWEQRVARQREIDASIAAKADHEFLYDKPYEDRSKVRVAGPFTVESLSPHRVLAVDEKDGFGDGVSDSAPGYTEDRDFAQVILENLKSAGVQQAHKEDRISFSSVAPWPGSLVCAEGLYFEGDEDSGDQKRAGIFIGPEFGTVSRPDLVEAAREAADGGFDTLVACAFNYDAMSTEFDKLGRIPVLKARMNADLHMADELKNTGSGNLFVIFGEPDIDLIPADEDMYQVKVNGVDVFDPNTGEVRSDGAEGIACWFVDTDYNEESFFVRHAYFLGANDPYKSLKTTLKAEIDEEAWESLHSDTSRPFEKPSSGRIAVKVINHLGDEVMKVFRL